MRIRFLVINEFGFGSLKLMEEDFLKKDFIIQFGYPPKRIDIINNLSSEDFNDVWLRKKVIEIEGVKINFIGYQDLIKLKQSSGRPQDLADIYKLKNRNK